MVIATRSKTTAPPRRPRPPPPDLASHPSEEDLITRFLRPRAAAASTNDPACASFVHDADVYSACPDELTAGFAAAVASNGESAWYFLSAVRTKTRDGQRKARTVDTGEGCWHSEAGAKLVVDETGRVLGHRQSFSFVTKVDGRRVRSGWLMVELSLDADDEEDNTDIVLCKIYFSNRARLNGVPHAAYVAGRKRKADAGDKNPASSRQWRRRLPTEGDVTADGEEKESIKGGEIGNERSAVAGDEEELWTDDSTLSWWMKNRDRFMKEYNIVDRSDEELHKTHGICEMMKLLNYDYGSSSRPQVKDDKDEEFSTWTELVTRS